MCNSRQHARRGHLRPSNDRAWGPYPALDPVRGSFVKLRMCRKVHLAATASAPRAAARTCLAILEVPSVLAAANPRLLAASPVAQWGPRMEYHSVPPGSSGTLRCARHPNTETVQNCGQLRHADLPALPGPSHPGRSALSQLRPDSGVFATLLKPRELAPSRRLRRGRWRAGQHASS